MSESDNNHSPPVPEQNTRESESVGARAALAGSASAASAPPAISRAEKYRRHLPAALICLILVALYLWPDQREIFIVYIVVGLALVMLGLVNIVLILVRPKRSGWRALNLAMVAATCIGLVAYADFNAQRGREAARRDAEVARMQVEAYRARTGAWPQKLSEAGVDARVIEKHRLYIEEGPSGASLNYRDNFDNGFMSVSGYIYDFQRKSWSRWAD